MAEPASQHCPECGAAVAVPKNATSVHCLYCGSQLLFLVDAGIKGRSSLIAVDCPTCGGKTEYPEDSYSLTCPFCKTTHLIAADNRVLRFYVPPRVSAEQARAQAGDGSGKIELAFLPYWRCRGLIYHWEAGLERKTDESPVPLQADGSWGLAELLAARTENELAVSLAGQARLDLSRFLTQEEAVRRLTTNAVDASLSAGALAGAMPSLSGRLRILSQTAFDLERMQKLGRVLQPVVPQAEALSRMTQGAYEDLVDYELLGRMEHGNLIGERLSVVWYPYWIASAGEKRWIVDAALGGLVGPAGPEDGRPALDYSAGVPTLITARCPVCGGDLPVDPLQPVKFCAPCQAAWRLEGAKLQRQPVKVIRSKDAKIRSSHLPLWRLTVCVESDSDSIRDQAALRRLVPGWDYTQSNADPKKPIHLYVPGWGNRVTPRLSAVAKRFTREQPELAFDGRFDGVLRNIVGPDEARELALIVLLSVIFVRKELPEFILNAKLAILDTELLLLPCREDSLHEWIEDIDGAAVPASEVTERRPN